ncbi:MAG TPA: peptidylprolyl isomerase [Pseudolabrys sp.]|nr:peptidylprolyl isomerase [Pseudolabrys sp.]
MSPRIAVIACLVLLGLALAGCTKCGWFWQNAQACHSDRVQ